MGEHAAVWWLIVLMAEINGFLGRGHVTDAVEVAAQARRRAYAQFWRRDVWEAACRAGGQTARAVLERPLSRTRTKLTAAMVVGTIEDDEFVRVGWRDEEIEVLDCPDYFPNGQNRPGRVIDLAEVAPPIMGSYGRVWTHLDGLQEYRKNKLFAWGIMDQTRLLRRWATVGEIERSQGLPDVVADGTEQGVAYHMLGNAVQRRRPIGSSTPLT